MVQELVLLDGQDDVIDNIDFGIVRFKAQKEITVWLKNLGKKEFINIELELNNPNMMILDAPKQLSSLEKAPVKIVWTAGENLESAQSKLVIRSNYVV